MLTMDRQNIPAPMARKRDRRRQQPRLPTIESSPVSRRFAAFPGGLNSGDTSIPALFMATEGSPRAVLKEDRRGEK